MKFGWARIGVVVFALAFVGAACSSGSNSSSGNDTTTTNAANASKGRSAGGDGNDVLAIQRELTSLGCAPGPLDGTLGPDTVAGIRRFQSASGLSADGIVGPNTRAALSFSAQTGTPRCPATPAPTTPTTTSASGGTPPCTDAALRPVVTASLSPGEQLYKLNAFNCAITWAVTTPTVGSTPQNAVEITVLLRWSGNAWQAVDRGVYCDSGRVPASIYQKACNSN